MAGRPAGTCGASDLRLAVPERAEEAGDDAAFRQNLAEFVRRARNRPELAEGVQRAEQILRETGGTPSGGNRD
jgi:hypothetical protein